WPPSFSVYVEDPNTSRDVLLRLRVYPEGKVRDYRGERFLAVPPRGMPADPVTSGPPPPGEGPRLLRDGLDITPETEPLPNLAIDQLLRLRVEPGVRGRVDVLLRGECVGTMADLEHGLTCVDTQNGRVPAPSATLNPDLTLPGPSSLVGTFGASM